MKDKIIIWIFILLTKQNFSQLLPSIGLNFKPADNASICTEPYYLGSFYSSGYQQGDTVNDFKLYDLNGDSLVLSQELSSGKPVLLIAGSLTCPVFRAKAATINKVASTYSNNIKVFVIYTLEAHPTDTSVYFGYVNITSQNSSSGILFPQPINYGLRKKLVDTMSTWVTLNVPIFIDGPCNNWWKNFGPAPNNSYLIGTNGIVLNKHGWFHKTPDNIYCDLDSIFSVNSGSCNPSPSSPGTFSLNVLNSMITGTPGDLLYDYVNIVNTSTAVTGIKIKKIQKALPVGWETAFCADICYGIMEDSIEVSVDPNDTLKFSLDFFTGAVPDSGSVKVGFKNTVKQNNAFSLWLRASTLPNTVGIKNPGPEERKSFELYPNPATDKLNIHSSTFPFEISVYDIYGREIYKTYETYEINVKNWPAGIYFVKLNGVLNSKKIVVIK
jgi:hypothetical protein